MWYEGEANEEGMTEQRFKGNTDGVYLCDVGTTISYTHETGNGQPKNAVVWFHKEKTKNPVDITLECTCEYEDNGMPVTARAMEMEIDAATASVKKGLIQETSELFTSG